MAARSKAMSIAGACARKRWFRQTHSSHRSVCRARARALHSGRRHGRREPAAVELVEARRLSPDNRYSSLARLRAVYSWGVRKIRALREATYFVGMRKAGMPGSDRNVRQSERRLDRLWRWPPVAWKFWGSSQRSNADLSAGHSLSRIENQQVSRLRAL